jgi:transitional endoplasmic reticulum ATPase
MEELQLFRGAHLVIRGKLRKETICVLQVAENCANEKILMSRVARNNAYVKISDVVTIRQLEAPLPNANRVVFRPIADTVEGLTG